MSVQVDVSEIDLDLDSFNRSSLPAPGKCHLLVDKVEERETSVSITCTILAHEKPSEVGKTTYNYFKVSGKGVKRLLEYCVACGVLELEDIATFFQEGPRFDIPSEKTKGKTFCGTLKKSSYNGKDKCAVEFGFFRPTSEEAADYPKDESVLGESEPNKTDSADDVVF